VLTLVHAVLGLEMSTDGDVSLSDILAGERHRARRAVARASALGDRVAAARRRQQTLLECARALRDASGVERARHHAGPRLPSIGRFVIEGLLDSRPVSAAWAGGRLTCDEDLRARALLLVDLEETFVYDDPPRVFIATLDGPPVAVALTLIRACDRVSRIMVAPVEAA
jgi:hypothetical protein